MPQPDLWKELTAKIAGHKKYSIEVLTVVNIAEIASPAPAGREVVRTRLTRYSGRAGREDVSRGTSVTKRAVRAGRWRMAEGSGVCK